MIQIFGINYNKKDKAVIVTEVPEVSEEFLYSVCVYSFSGSFEQFFGTGNKPQAHLASISENETYIVAIHDIDNKLVEMKHYKFDELNISEYNPLELDYTEENTQENTQENTKPQEGITLTVKRLI